MYTKWPFAHSPHAPQKCDICVSAFQLVIIQHINGYILKPGKSIGDHWWESREKDKKQNNSRNLDSLAKLCLHSIPHGNAYLRSVLTTRRVVPILTNCRNKLICKTWTLRRFFFKYEIWLKPGHTSFCSGTICEHPFCLTMHAQFVVVLHFVVTKGGGAN